MPDVAASSENTGGTLSNILNGANKLFDLIGDSTTAKTLSVIGFTLLLVAIYCIIRGVNTQPDRVPGWYKVMLFMCLVGSGLFSTAGAAISLVSVPALPRVPVDKAIQNLHDNARVKYLIRLIAYHPNRDTYLDLSKLTHLGRETQQFTFVADYDELRGYTVTEAVRKSGGKIDPDQYVSAIIFPLPSGQVLYPVNARGMLQVVRKLERSQIVSEQGFYRLDVDKTLRSKDVDADPEAVTDLDNTKLPSWSWPAYGRNYKQYCTLAFEFACDQKYTARDFLGEISRDWHPLGFARQDAHTDSCQERERLHACSISDWAKAKSEITGDFGARVFLLPNMKITDLERRYMIKFTQPDSQIIPFIDVPRPVK